MYNQGLMFTGAGASCAGAWPSAPCGAPSSSFCECVSYSDGPSRVHDGPQPDGTLERHVQGVVGAIQQGLHGRWS